MKQVILVESPHPPKLPDANWLVMVRKIHIERIRAISTVQIIYEESCMERVRKKQMS